MGIPDICTVQELEICPEGTVQAGYFVRGDGNPATNQVTNPDLSIFDSVLAGIFNHRDDNSATNRCTKYEHVGIFTRN